MRRLILPVLATALLVGVLVVGVFPTRSYLSQRRAIAAAGAQAGQLGTTNDSLQNRVDQLQTDSEVERLARQEYGLVKPGEEVYEVLPPPEDPPKVPDAWPFNRLEQRLAR